MSPIQNAKFKKTAQYYYRAHLSSNCRCVPTLTSTGGHPSRIIPSSMNNGRSPSTIPPAPRMGPQILQTLSLRRTTSCTHCCSREFAKLGEPPESLTVPSFLLLVFRNHATKQSREIERKRARKTAPQLSIFTVIFRSRVSRDGAAASLLFWERSQICAFQGASG